MFAPLKRITHATRVAASGSLSQRVRLLGRNDEPRELADAFDALLARLEAEVAAQRRFAANASHELRTPSAVTKSLLDVARSDPDADTGELVDRLDAVNTRLRRGTERVHGDLAGVDLGLAIVRGPSTRRTTEPSSSPRVPAGGLSVTVELPRAVASR